MAFIKYEFAEVVHINFSIVAGAGEWLKENFFILIDVFCSHGWGLIFFDILFGLDSDLKAADFIVFIN